MTTKPQFQIVPKHRRGPAQDGADEAYPTGKAFDLSWKDRPSCTVELPYPAPERLVWMVTCRKCGYSLAITAAGRADDPTSVKIPCKDPGERDVQ